MTEPVYIVERLNEVLRVARAVKGADEKHTVKLWSDALAEILSLRQQVEALTRDRNAFKGGLVSDTLEINALKAEAARLRSQLSAAEQDARLVTVCSSCLQASCWQGEFYCDDYRRAGTVSLPVAALRALKRESPHYWIDAALPEVKQ